MSAPGGITIVVYGEPAPQGSKRFVGVRAGRGVMVESSKKVKPWRQDVAAVRVKMVFTVRKPLSAPKRRRTYPSAKPDLSKLARATEDALTTAGIWEDDARVVEYSRLAKVFPGEDPDALDSPGVLIDISAVV